MDSAHFTRLAARLLRHPAAPYHEREVRAEVEAICREADLRCRRDKFGNLIISLRTDPRLRPLVFCAHLDHPGFEIVRRLGSKEWHARFRGGVATAYFREGTGVRLLPQNVPGVLGKPIGGEKEYALSSRTPLREEPTFAVWDVCSFERDGELIRARACDDLIGVTCALAALIELKQVGAKVNVLCAFTRAEEVGFHGALALAASQRLPKKALAISLETSKELPGVKMGEGVILRVGDRASIFDSEACRFLSEVAEELKPKEPSFRFQRALMAGGTCEASAYQEFGIRSTALCIALGNYHNCGPKEQIRAEYVSLADALGMTQLLVAAAQNARRYREFALRFPGRLKKLLREAQLQLPKSA